MGKLTLTCACSQEMLVPETAIGRVGLCPACGREINITAENTRTSDAPAAAAPPAPPKPGGGLMSRRKVQQTNAREEAGRKFASAVDLYNNRRYAEALAVLESMMVDFPGDAHIEAARLECLQALQGGNHAPRVYESRIVPQETLNEDLVRSIVLEKLINGGSEDVQLQAAELAAKLLGMMPHGNGNGHGAPPLSDIILMPAAPAMLEHHAPAQQEEAPVQRRRRKRGNSRTGKGNS